MADEWRNEKGETEMSETIDGVFVISPERPQQCDLCGAIAELRPYGPNGECVCFTCGMKNEPAAVKRFYDRLGVSKAEQDAIRKGGGDRPA